MKHQVFALDDHTWRIQEYDDQICVYMYLLEGEREAALIDTGMGMIDLRNLAESLTQKPLKVLNTHGHFDHAGGNSAFDCSFIHEEDIPVYRAYCGGELQTFFPQYSFPAPTDRLAAMHDGDVFDLGGRTLQIIHTPGHTVGSVCILDRERRWLFTGDTCCKADVLLNLPYAASVEQYRNSMARLQRLRSCYDITWPAHHQVPVRPEILDQFLQAAQLLCGKQAEGDSLNTVFGPCKRFAIGEIAVVY